MIDWTVILGGLALGLIAGVLGGMFGIGGGLVMVPAMIVVFGFATKTATGTSLLAQVLPVGLLGVLAYHREGHVRLGFGLSMSLGLFVGILGGALVAGQIPGPVMKRLYGVFLLACGLYFVLAPTGVTPKPKAEPIEAGDVLPEPESEGEAPDQAVH